MLIAAEHNPCMVATLIAHKANVHLVDEGGWTPLHHGAGENHVEAINALLKGGAKVNQLNKGQMSPLFCAAWSHAAGLTLVGGCNHREAVTALLDAGADPHLGLSPLDNSYVKDEMKKFIREKIGQAT